MLFAQSLITAPVGAQANAVRAQADALRPLARSQGAVEVLAKLRSPSASASAMSYMMGRGAQSARLSRKGDFVKMRLTEAGLQAAVDSGQFTVIEENVKMHASLAGSVPLINADFSARIGAEGNGTVIAVIDGGVDNDHPSLNVVAEACFSDDSGNRSSICADGAESSTATNSADACVEDATGVTGCGHGTHVAGIASGNACTAVGCIPNDGVAPGADIAAINVFFKEPCTVNGVLTECLSSDTGLMADALDHVLDLLGEHNIVAVNMSMGGNELFGSHCDTTQTILKSRIDALVDAGIPVVVASGNDGSAQGISMPACYSNVISVGNSTAAFDTICPSSNSDDILDVLAPGSGRCDLVDEIDSAEPLNFGDRNGVADMRGTSMAAPHVAGAIAAMIDVDGSLTPAEIEDILKDTGIGITDARNSLTRPRIDVLAAVERVAGGYTSEEADDTFGMAVASGDFNGDSFDDLAVGAPYEGIGNASNAGMVVVYYGSESGPSMGVMFTQDALLDSPDSNDLFGWSLAAGDFNGDGEDDLAVGVPWEDVNGVADAGAVAIIYGSPNGLVISGNQLLHQDTANVAGVSQAGDHFGWSLASGRIGGGSFDSLAIGVPEEDVGNFADCGAVNVLRGSSAGLSATGNQVWTQDVAGVEGVCAAGDRLGFDVAIGDLNADLRADLVVSAPYEDVSGFVNAGAVNVLYSTANGLEVANNQIWNQDSGGVLGSAQTDDQFGFSIAIGDFNNNRSADLAVGIPGELNGALDNSGAVAILYGSTGRIINQNNQLFHQDSPDVPDTVEANDRFGTALVAADFNFDNRADLAIGAPYDDTGNRVDAGLITVLYGGTVNALTALGSQIFSQGSPGVPGADEADDRTGFSIGAGDFDSDGRADVAIGVPYEDGTATEDVNAGAVIVLRGVNASGVGTAGAEMIIQ